MAKAKTQKQSSEKVEKTTKAKKTTTRKAKAKTEKAKSNIPVIHRPRSITVETFNEYTTSAMANFDYRIEELEKMHADGKCPHKAIQHMRSLQKELVYLTKRITPIIKPRRKQTDKKNNILMKKVEVSPKLAKFLKLKKGEQVSRSECNTAVTMYINVKDVDKVSDEKRKWLDRMNPNGKRCLQSKELGSVIEPDDALSDLLDYPAYQKKVAAGKHFWNRKNKETGVKERVKETDDKLTYAVIQHLLAPHFKTGKTATKAVEESEVSEE